MSKRLRSAPAVENHDSFIWFPALRWFYNKPLMEGRIGWIPVRKGPVMPP